MKKKKVFIMKKKKRLVQKPFLGYCPIVLGKKKRRFLYCKPCNCIARERAGKKICSENCIAIPFLYCRKEGLRG